MRYVSIIFSLMLMLAACSDDEQITPAPQQLAVTYANIAGEWELVKYNSTPLAEGTYVRLSLDRRERTFVMRDNLQSMYGQERTGKYTITYDDDTEQYCLSGTYDNGVGEWAHQYVITSLTEGELQLSTPTELSVYRRL